MGPVLQPSSVPTCSGNGLSSCFRSSSSESASCWACTLCQLRSLLLILARSTVQQQPELPGCITALAEGLQQCRRGTAQQMHAAYCICSLQ